MSSPRIHIDDTFGAAFVGVIVAAVLHGVSCAQAWYYFTHQNDKWLVKTLVSFVMLFDTIHQVLISHTVYTYLVSNYNNQEQLKYLVWSVLVEVLFNGFTAFLVQSFLARRVWQLSGRNIWLTGLVAFLVLSEFGCVLAFAALSLRFTTYEQLGTLKELSITVNALGAAGDVVIAFALCVLLHRSRTGFQRSDSMINKLIIFAVNTGVLTSLCAIASLISASPRLIAVAPDTFLYIAFFFCLGRLYSNSLLATLNARKMIRAASGGIQSTSDHNNISFREIPATKSLKSIARLNKARHISTLAPFHDFQFATDVEPSTQSQQMDDITDALEMEIMSAIADEEKQSGSSNMSLDSTSKSAHARPFVAELRPMRTQLTAPTPNTLIATVYGHCKDSAAQTHYGTVDNHDDEHVVPIFCIDVALLRPHGINTHSTATQSQQILPCSMSDYVPRFALPDDAQLDPSTILHPRPEVPLSTCPTCNTTGHMSSLRHCEGTGKRLENYGRWYQLCYNPTCRGTFHWHNPETPLEHIPLSVQLRFAQRQSAEEAASASADGLPCSNGDCLKATGQVPRRANKSCIRQHCKQCCSAKGGCDAPGHRGATAPVAMPAQNSAKKATAPSPSIARTYARPLSESYARAYGDIYRKRQGINEGHEVAEQASIELARLVRAVLFIKPNGSPQRLNLSSLHARTLVILSDERAFMTIMPDSEFIYTYDNGSGNWVGQDIRSPIAVGPHGSILLRSPALAEEDCLGLDEEIYLFSTGKTSQSLPAKATNSESPRVAGVSAVPKHTPSAATTIVKQFPVGLYTCDFVQGMVILDQAVGDEQIKAAFAKAFPRYRFVRATVYANRKTFRNLQQTHADLLQTYVNLGRTKEGLWASFRAAITSLPSLVASSESTASMNTTELVPPITEDPNSPNYTIRTVRIEHFHYADGIIASSYTPENDSLNAIMQLPAIKTGYGKSIYYVHTSYNGQQVEFAFKILRTALAQQVANDLAVATWQEALRLYECRLLAESFHERAVELDISVFLFTILPAYFVVSGRMVCVGQCKGNLKMADSASLAEGESKDNE
ncbi:hypothetical protein CCMSSC00406_0004784 [Pleurotus cornucopiae]|uniref:Uncharacterized protein n=1 Tax=Pleurotus cornucopiae TaxID=5321 RepID=A0ACB7J239_PLECO|nr:hypothetical protein CCMSSC00406_0004784 [Pleurotus cornucopiae]